MENQQQEFQKLDGVDRKVALWMVSHQPKALKDWTDDVHNEYARRKNIKIDKEQLYKEIVTDPSENSFFCVPTNLPII